MKCALCGVRFGPPLNLPCALTLLNGRGLCGSCLGRMMHHEDRSRYPAEKKEREVYRAYLKTMKTVLTG